MARTSRRAVRRGGIDPSDEPSVEWGWHGGFPRALPTAGVVVAIVLLALIIGPYQSRTQDLWIVGVVIAILAWIAYGARKRRNAWRR